MSLPGYNWLVSGPEILGGKPVVRGTRLSAAFILACISEVMVYEEIADTYVLFRRKQFPKSLSSPQNYSTPLLTTMWLLDVNVPQRTTSILAEFGIEARHSVSYGWNELKNGDLVGAAVNSGFVCVVTRDRASSNPPAALSVNFPASGRCF